MKDKFRNRLMTHNADSYCKVEKSNIDQNIFGKIDNNMINKSGYMSIHLCQLYVYHLVPAKV